MQFLLALATFVATISAAAIPRLDTRATCPAAGASFYLQVSDGGSFTGKYAHAGAPDTLPFVIFGVKPKPSGGPTSRATVFSLTAAGNLISVQNGKTYVAYDTEPGENTGHIAITTNLSIGNKLVCSIDSSSCAVKCSAAGYTYNYLASPKFQPDWRIAGAVGASHKGQVPFTPVAVPSS